MSRRQFPIGMMVSKYLIIYHRSDNVYYVPNEGNRLRMQLWEQQRWAYIIERRLQEESLQENSCDIY